MPEIVFFLGKSMSEALEKHKVRRGQPIDMNIEELLNLIKNSLEKLGTSYRVAQSVSSKMATSRQKVMA